MIMQVEIGNPDHPEYGVATVPFPIPAGQYRPVIEMLEQLEVGHPTERDCKIREMYGWPKVLDRLCGQNINVDELDYLAKRLESFDEYEQAQYQGTVFEHDLRDMTDLINQTFCCQEATIVTNFADLEHVGRQHYLTVKGGCTPDELRAVDGVETAYLLFDTGAGKVTPFGVVYDNLMKMEHLYDGIHFPDYRYSDSEMAVEVIAPDRSQKPTWLYLPMPQEQIQRLLIRGDAETHHIDIENHKLSPKVMGIIESGGNSIYALNDLCEAISVLDNAERRKLDAVIEFAFPEIPTQVAQLARNLEMFDFYPNVNSPEDYGRYMIQESGHFTYDPELDEFYDYKSYGNERISNESGRFTRDGYVAYNGALSLDELMMEDPAEQYQREQGMEMGGMA